MSIDLKRLTAKQALGLAKSISGKTNEMINEEMGQDISTIKRYFNENDTDYYPSLVRLPRLCKSLGNTVLLDWISDQMELHCSGIDVSSENKLLRKINKISVEMGDIHSSIEKYLSNGRNPVTSRELIGALFDVERQCKEFRCGLQRMTREEDEDGWESAVVKND